MTNKTTIKGLIESAEMASAFTQSKQNGTVCKTIYIKAQFPVATIYGNDDDIQA